MPMADKALSTLLRVSGNGIWIVGSVLKPLRVPSLLTTFVEPILRASFRAVTMSVLERLARDVCPVLPVAPPIRVLKVSELRIVPTLAPHPSLLADAPPVIQPVRAMEEMRSAVLIFMLSFSRCRGVTAMQKIEGIYAFFAFWFLWCYLFVVT